MFHPTRGGVRGGKDQFTWESVKTDKDRECYLGHSIMAPIGRWQEGKDLHWYNKEGDNKKKINEEFLSAKEMEEKALMAALGYKVVDKPKQAEATKSDYEEEKRKKRQKSPDEREKRKKKHKSSSDESNEEDENSESKKVKGPQMFELGDEKEIDDMLLKLVDKYGFDKVYDALIEDDEHKSKKKKKHKKKSKKSKKRKDQSDDSDDDDDKKRSKKSHKKSDKNKSKSSSSSDSD